MVLDIKFLPIVTADSCTVFNFNNVGIHGQEFYFPNTPVKVFFLMVRANNGV